ncbi:ABC transporter substrate-binding protein [Pseudonocardia humida]|uniref:ABC transporter substrate-binding protein n=1 Tax=Pseudonocardia humida TaxID=2800819 RepID=A0ABT1A252_9PSEU|nr:ABC transporter substrate-binding protein [Pseudonocardia humida]MCO1657077.1 ABC transporter substrate-binding protein [Pseudonocardia humida]
MSLNRRRFLMGAGAVAAGGLLSACGSGDSGGSGSGGGGGGEPIKIGYVAALTGPVAAYGTQTLNALQLAARDLNGLGGIMGRPVEIEAVDNGSKPDAVPALMRQLATDGCAVLFGASASPPTIVAAQTADQLRVPLVVPMEAADAIIGEGRQYVFKVAPSVLAENGWAAQSVRAAMGAAQAAGQQPATAMILHASTGAYPEARDAWVRTFAEEFPGVQVLQVLSFDEAATSDYAPLVSQAQAANPDLLVFGGNPQSAFQFYPALARSGWNPKATISCLGGNTNTQFIESVGAAAAENDIAGNYWTPKLAAKPGAQFSPQKFYDDYVAAYGGQKPDGVGAYYYASLGLVADALTQAGSTDNPQTIMEALRATEFDGLSGDSNGMFIVGHGVKFDARGQNTAADGVVTQIQNGDYVPVYPEAVATAQVVYPRVAVAG